MTILLDEDFEGAASGTTLTGANSGFTGTISGTPTFDSTRAVTGTRSMLINPVAGVEYAGHVFTLTPTFSVRKYFWLAGLPAATVYPLTLQSGATVRAQLGINPDGTLRIRNGVTLVDTSDGVVAGAGWYRVEWRVSNTSGIQSLRIFLGSSTSPLGTDTSGAYNQGTIDRCLVGLSTAGTITANIDTLRMTDTDEYLGPAGGTFGPPANLAAAVISSSRVDLSWDAATGATGYDVERNSAVVASPAGTSYSDTGLLPSTAYTYRVRSTN